MDAGPMNYSGQPGHTSPGQGVAGQPAWFGCSKSGAPAGRLDGDVHRR